MRSSSSPSLFDLHVLLVEPEIPQNTGNIARTCAALGIELHLAGPLGFSLADRYLKRAGLDYWDEVTVVEHESLDGYLEAFPDRLLILTSRRGRRPYSDIEYPSGSTVVFGKETAGLPARLTSGREEETVRIPMRLGIRSLNLSNAVAVVVYEAFRAHGFPGLDLGEGDR